jgi:hypothetical protein
MEFIRPQRVYRDAQGNPEVINVSLAQHPNCAHSDGAFYGDVNSWDVPTTPVTWMSA